MAVPLITGTTLDSLGQRSLDFARLDADMAKARANTEMKRIEMMQKAMSDAAGAAAQGHAINSNERLGIQGQQNQYDLGMAPYMSSTGNARIWGDVMGKTGGAGGGGGIGGIGGMGGAGGLDASSIAAILQALIKARKGGGGTEFNIPGFE